MEKNMGIGKGIKSPKKVEEAELYDGSGISGIAEFVGVKNPKDTISTGTLEIISPQTFSLSAEDAICEKMEDLKNSKNLPSPISQKLVLPAGIKPYYHDEQSGIAIFCGDCRDILPHLDPVDLVLTDPPYLNFNKDHGKNWEQLSVADIKLPDVKQFIFWPAKGDFPLDYTAIHIWHKPNGQSQWHYEKIYERFGNTVYRCWSIPIINYKTLSEWEPHPAQKPIRLIKKLLTLQDSQIILDPFMGSGTTLRAAKDLGRKAIGIEIEEKYCEIAVKRLQQEVLKF
jgi:site-specific DNA-methyltransferase (adenine-specific)